MSQQREAIDTYLLRVLHTLLDGAQRHPRGRQAQSVTTRHQRGAQASARHHGRPAARARQSPAWCRPSTACACSNPRKTRCAKSSASRSSSTTSSRRLPCGVIASAVPDYLNVLFVPTVVERFRIAAPNATLEFHSLGPAFDYELALEDGKLDIVVGNWPEPPEQLHLSNLFVDKIVCLVVQHASVRQARRAHARPIPQRAASRADAVFGRPARRDRCASGARAASSAMWSSRCRTSILRLTC